MTTSKIQIDLTKKITKRQWEEMTKTDTYHLLRLENETYLSYEIQRLYYRIKHLFV